MSQANPPIPPPPPSSSPPPPGEPMQFDTAEPAAGPAQPPTCVGCQQPIVDTYYAAGDKVVCPMCRDQYVASMTGGSGFNRFLKATLFGIGAGAVGAAIWYGIMAATDRVWGLVAIIVGLMVGAAVRAGSERRGGRGYQFLAVIITYLSIGAAFIPLIMRDALDQGAATPVALFAAVVLSVIAPFRLPIIAMVIAAFALWEAWKMNAANQATLTGPYSIANQPGAFLVPPAPAPAAPAPPGTT